MSIWHALIGAICWGLWKEINSRIFDDKRRSPEKVLSSIYKTSFEWASVWVDFKEEQWNAIWCQLV